VVPPWYKPLVSDQTGRANTSFSNHGHAVLPIQQIQESNSQWPHDTPTTSQRGCALRAKCGMARIRMCVYIPRPRSTAEGRCYTAAVMPFIDCPSYTRKSIGGVLCERTKILTILTILGSLRISSACCNKGTGNAACKLADRVLQISVSLDWSGKIPGTRIRHGRQTPPPCTWCLTSWQLLLLAICCQVLKA
jgi:hypothetical protein